QGRAARYQRGHHREGGGFLSAVCSSRFVVRRTTRLDQLRTPHSALRPTNPATTPYALHPTNSEPTTTNHPPTHAPPSIPLPDHRSALPRDRRHGPRPHPDRARYRGGQRHAGTLDRCQRGG